MKDYLQQWNSSKLQFFKKFEKKHNFDYFCIGKRGEGSKNLVDKT